MDGVKTRKQDLLISHIAVDFHLIKKFKLIVRVEFIYLSVYITRFWLIQDGHHLTWIYYFHIQVNVSVSAKDPCCIEVVLRCLATEGDGVGPHNLNNGGVLASVLAAGFKGGIFCFYNDFSTIGF